MLIILRNWGVKEFFGYYLRNTGLVWKNIEVGDDGYSGNITHQNIQPLRNTKFIDKIKKTRQENKKLVYLLK